MIVAQLRGAEFQEFRVPRKAYSGMLPHRDGTRNWIINWIITGRALTDIATAFGYPDSVTYLAQLDVLGKDILKRWES